MIACDNITPEICILDTSYKLFVMLRRGHQSIRISTLPLLFFNIPFPIGDLFFLSNCLYTPSDQDSKHLSSCYLTRNVFMMFMTGT